MSALLLLSTCLAGVSASVSDTFTVNVPVDVLVDVAQSLPEDVLVTERVTVNEGPAEPSAAIVPLFTILSVGYRPLIVPYPAIVVGSAKVVPKLSVKGCPMVTSTA